MRHLVRPTLVRLVKIAALSGAAVVLASPRVSAQTVVLLPDTSQTTTLTATVGEQARVSFPASATFAVNDITSTTNSTGVSISVSNIVLATASKQLRVSLQSDTSGFTPPVGGATTWSAGDVTWVAGSWTNATGASGTLSNSAYNVVATCTADVASCSTAGFVFTLAANTNIKRSGNHTLVVRWKVESI